MKRITFERSYPSMIGDEYFVMYLPAAGAGGTVVGLCSDFGLLTTGVCWLLFPVLTVLILRDVPRMFAAYVNYCFADNEG